MAFTTVFSPLFPAKNRPLETKLACWIFLTTLAARLFALARLARSPYLMPASGDMKFYSDWALRIASGETSEPHAFYGLPGYAYFLAAIYWVGDFGLYLLSAFHTIPLAQPHPIFVGILQSISESLIAVLIFKICRAVFKNEACNDTKLTDADTIGLIAAIGWILFEPANTFSIVLMPTTWLVLAYWGCILWLLKIKSHSIWQPWFWMGLLVGMMAMVIATILFIVPLIFAAAFLHAGRESFSFARLPRVGMAIACVVTGIFAGASPCWIHNYFVAREPVFLSAHSGINFYIGNNPIANGYPKIPPGMRAGQEGMLKDSITMAEAALGHPMTRAEVSKYWQAKASEFTYNHPLEWLRLMLTKFKNFWNAFQYDDLSLITLFRQDHIILPGIGFGFAAALAIPGIFIAWRKHPLSRWVIAAILLHLCALMPVFITERYRLAAAPGLLMIGSFALVELWNKLVQLRWKESLLQAAGTFLAAGFIAWPPADIGLWSLDPYNTGVKALEVHDLKRAEENLELAYSYVPQNSEINFALGNLWLDKGDKAKAKQFYRRAVEINSRHAGAYNNLGVLAMEEKRFDLAARFFQKSLAIDPGDAKAWYLLASVRLEQGNKVGAREAIDKAIRLNPRPQIYKDFKEKLDR